MDIPRDESHLKRKKMRRTLSAVGAVLALILITIWLSSLKASAYPVERETVWIEAVKRGEMLRQVRGPGTLVPEEIQWITAETDGQVEKKVLLPGTEVGADSVILQLSNPELEQQALNAQLDLKAAESASTDLAVRLQSEILSDEAVTARVNSEYEQARLDRAAQEELAKDGLTPAIVLKRAQLREQQLAQAADIEKQRLAKKKESVVAQLASQRSRVEQLRALYELRRNQLARLEVRAGINGVLQEVAVEVGQRVAPGARLAMVANPSLLKAVLQIPQVQAKDLLLGQKAEVDTRNGLVEGRVKRIDPAVREGSVTVDVEIVGQLPKGARPDLSVEGTVEIERLPEVLYVGRPAAGQPNSRMELFKVGPDGEAVRVPVSLGRSSVNTIEILEGLREGDQVILSDTSSWDEHQVIQLK